MSAKRRKPAAVKPRRRAADKSIGFGRVKMDWPDLWVEHQLLWKAPGTVTLGHPGKEMWFVWDVWSNGGRVVLEGVYERVGGYVLSHDDGKPAELEHVTGDEQERVEDLLLLARVPASCEEDEEDSDHTKGGYDEIHDIPEGFPELLREDKVGRQITPRVGRPLTFPKATNRIPTSRIIAALMMNSRM